MKATSVGPTNLWSQQNMAVQLLSPFENKPYEN